MFKCDKTHDSRLRGLVGSTNRERRGVTEAGTTRVDSSEISVHNVNSHAIWSICTYLLKRGLHYAMHMRRYILLASICNKYHHENTPI